jgi:receptor protein-tyrosine kinase
LAKYLDVIGSVGVSTVLSGGAALDEVLQQTKFPRLSVLAAGPTPPNPSELLGSIAAEKMLSELRSRFDYVIIDSAPLLAVTDGAILAAKSDGALVVVKAGKTRRDQLAHAIGMLNDVGATLLGAVLTMMPTRGSGAYSYNYNYYGGSYGEGGRGNAESRQSTDEVTAVTAVDAIPDTEEHHHAGAGIAADESLGGRSAASE